MPTIEVTSTPLTASARLRVALRLTRWLSDQGSAATHAVVTFRAAEPMSYFAGGVPLSAYEEGAEAAARQARWASVVCRIHPERDRAYMAALAREVRDALGLTGKSDHCVIRFEPTRPDRVLYAQAGDLTTDAPALAASSQEGQAHAGN